MPSARKSQNSLVYEAPYRFERKGNPFVQAVFLGGGITGCPDWQKRAIKLLRGVPAVLLNPRRKNFDVTNPSETNEQIGWEFSHLRKSNIIIFWFPKETLCPITLYELGYWLAATGKRRVLIGVHRKYARRKDIETQTHLLDPSIRISYSLKDLCERVKKTLAE